MDFLRLAADSVTLAGGGKYLNENDRKVVRTVQPVSNFYHMLICAAIRSAKTSLSTWEEESRARTQLRKRELESSDHMLSATQPDFALVFESLCV